MTLDRKRSIQEMVPEEPPSKRLRNDSGYNSDQSPPRPPFQSEDEKFDYQFVWDFLLEDGICRNDLGPHLQVTRNENELHDNNDEEISRYFCSIKGNYLQQPPIKPKPDLSDPDTCDGVTLGFEGLLTCNTLTQSTEQLNYPNLESPFNSVGTSQQTGEAFIGPRNPEDSENVISARVTNFANLICLDKNQTNGEVAPHRCGPEFKQSSNDDEIVERPSSADIFLGYSDSLLKTPLIGNHFESSKTQNPVLVIPYDHDVGELQEILQDVSEDEQEDAQDIVFDWIEKSFARATNSTTASFTKVCDEHDVNQRIDPEDKRIFHSIKRQKEIPAVPGSRFETVEITDSEKSDLELATVATKIEILTSGATNLKCQGLSRCILTLDNLETELSKFLQNSNINQRFKIRYKENMYRTIPFKELGYDELKDLVSDGTISIEKLPLNCKKIETNTPVLTGKKTSIILCKSILDGLALSEKWDEIRNTPGLDTKQKNNKFSNYQRSDRNAGKKLTEEYLKKYGLGHWSSYSDIEGKCCLSIATIGSNGNLKYFSSRYRRNVVYFFENDEKIFFVKNLAGFCRTS
ncbi:hypothetical protein ACHWQZ_G014223 [Mnemiopsis leidyi]